MNGTLRGNTRSATISPLAQLPPRDVDTESAILGGLMINPEAFHGISTILAADDFYDQDNSTIFRAIENTVQFGAIVDQLTVSDALRRMGVLGDGKERGKIALRDLYNLTRDVRFGENILRYAQIVKELSLRRQAIVLLGKAYNTVYDDTVDIFDAIGSAQVSLGNLTDQIRTSSVKRLDAILADTLKGMEENSKIQGHLIGLPTGLNKMDEVTGGFSSPDFIIMAAGPGEGKTTFAINSALNMAMCKSPVAFFSLEMKGFQLAWKILAGELGVDVKQIRSGKLSPDQWLHLNTVTTKKLSGVPFHVYDVGGLPINELKAIARTLVIKKGIKALFVDYLQLVRGPHGKKFGTREEEVNFVSKELKSLAMELNIPVIALSQLSRMEKGGKRTYRLSDLRESGAIEQDADGVIFIWNPFYHGLREITLNSNQISFQQGEVLILIEKWRLGPTGHFMAVFDGLRNTFRDSGFDVNQSAF